MSRPKINIAKATRYLRYHYTFYDISLVGDQAIMIVSKVFCIMTQTNHKYLRSLVKINRLLPYKATVESAACFRGILVLTVWTSTSQDSRSNLYQRSNVKSVPEKWIKFRIFSLSYTKKVKNLIHLGWVKIIVSLSSTSVLTLTYCVGRLFNVTGVSAMINLHKRPLLYTTWHGKCFLKIITNLKIKLKSHVNS